MGGTEILIEVSLGVSVCVGVGAVSSLVASPTADLSLPMIPFSASTTAPSPNTYRLYASSAPGAVRVVVDQYLNPETGSA